MHVVCVEHFYFNFSCQIIEIQILCVASENSKREKFQLKRIPVFTGVSTTTEQSEQCQSNSSQCEQFKANGRACEQRRFAEIELDIRA